MLVCKNKIIIHRQITTGVAFWLLILDLCQKFEILGRGENVKTKKAEK